MIKIMFVCHGNICRSTMAEFVMNNMIKSGGNADEIRAYSSAVSREEIGNGVHHGTLNILRKNNVPVYHHTAVQLCANDYDKYDYFIGMDSSNLSGMRRILGDDYDNKTCLLLDFSDCPRDIADPWYTGNFEDTYNDVVYGCECLLKSLHD